MSFREFFPTSSDRRREQRIDCAVTSVQNMTDIATHFATASLTCISAQATAHQCFPFYTYDEDGTNRRENITDWALEQFQAHYDDPTSPSGTSSTTSTACCTTRLPREVRRQPQARAAAHPLRPARDFRAYVDAGAELAALHRDYQSAPEYPLTRLENRDAPFSWRVETMRLSADRASLRYNPSLTLEGIPTRSLLIQAGQPLRPRGSPTNTAPPPTPAPTSDTDPNDPDDPQYIPPPDRPGHPHLPPRTVEIIHSLPPLAAEPPHESTPNP